MFKTKRVTAICAVVALAVFASCVAASAQMTRLAAPTARIAPVLGQNLLASKLGAISDPSLGSVATMGYAGGKSYGAGAGKLGLIGENGLVASSLIAVPVQRPAGISEYASGRLLLGDAASNSIFVVDPGSKRSSKLLSLASLQADQKMDTAGILKNCELASLAFDGKLIFAAVRAGYASSIFKIDPATKRVLGHAWAPGSDPAAMQFSNGNLYVLDGAGQKIRRYDSSFNLSMDSADTGVADGKGLAIVNGEARILSQSARSVTRLRLDLSKFTGVVAAPQTLDISSIQGQVIVPMPIGQKYAVLISTLPAQSGYDEMWNDLVWLYKTLRGYGYTEQNIYVLYANGYDYICPNPMYRMSEWVTDLPATMPAINAVFMGLKNGNPSLGIQKVTANDKLLIWTHGPGYGNAYSGYLVAYGGAYLYDAQFAAWVNSLPCKRAIFMQQVSSGSFADNFTNPLTFISTACMGGQYSYRADTEKEYYGGRYYNHGEFGYHINCALSQHLRNGSVCNSDYNSNGKASAREAHQWDMTHENRPEVPQFRDVGGVGVNFHVR